MLPLAACAAERVASRPVSRVRVAPAPAAAPADGAALARSGFEALDRGDAAGSSQLFARAVTAWKQSGVAPRLESAADYYGRPIGWSWDRRWLVRRAPERIVVSDSATSAPRFVTDGVCGALGSDGRLLAVKGTDFGVYVFDTWTGHLVRRYAGDRRTPVDTFDVYEGMPFALALSPHDRWLASREGAGIRLWSLSGQDRTKLPGVSRQLAFSGDGRYLAGGRRGWSLLERQLWYGTLSPTKGEADAEGGEDETPPAPVAVGGNTVLLAPTDGDTPSLMLIHPGHGVRRVAVAGQATALAVSRDGSIAAAALGTLTFVDPETGGMKRSSVELSPGRSLAFSADGRTLHYVDASGVARRMRVAGRAPEPAPAAAPSRITATGFTADGGLLLGTRQGRVVRWNLASGARKALTTGKSAVSALAARGSRVAVGYADGSIVVLDGARRIALPGYDKPVVYLAFDASGTGLLTKCEDGDYHLVDTASAKVRHAWHGSIDTNVLRLSQDGRRLARLSFRAGKPALLELDDSGSLRGIAHVGVEVINLGGLAIDAGGSTVVTTRVMPQSVVVWHPGSPARSYALELTGSRTGQALSPSGRWLVVSERRQRIELEDLSAGRFAGGFESMPYGIDDVQFSPDERFLAGVAEGRVWLWLTDTRALLAELSLATDDSACVVAPDGSGEILGASAACAVCRAGPFVVPARACGSSLLRPGLLEKAVAAR